MEKKFPARIWLRPCHPCRDESDYYVCHPDYLSGSETGYVRVDVVDEALAALKAMLAHSCVADAGPNMKDPDDEAAERAARTLIAKLEGRS